ncbi:glycogen synthase GlgA [Planomicrobium chinense]|uniref:glycogen synthase GlgA n=1 Tax=Planococcus chinensis TaxID=272917 RepID=UPI001CC5F093|nr:glycogen synthase GlgA [Planococcus chinensis]MBZ5200823.1 glycogen synthase GlgA [Planococcus chinensis]
MKIVMAAAECVPFVKTGGLADVMGALPKELVALGHEVTVILPKYSLIPEEYKNEFSLFGEIQVPFKGQQNTHTLFEYVLKGVRYVLVENDSYFAREQIYSQPDDGERFAFFNRAVLAAVETLEEGVDILHIHDWHTGMIPFLLKEDERYAVLKGKLKTILTIHNLQFQGWFPKTLLVDELEMDDSHFHEEAVAWHNNVNFLKTGIVYADKVTTVSPTYRNEILTEQYGEKLDSLLRTREEDLIGILNGLDTEAYNPAADMDIEMVYDQTSVENKAVNKRAVQSRFGLPERGDVPLLTMVSRLSGQKGIDVLEQALPGILEAQDVQFVLLGSGESQYEQFFEVLEADFPGQVVAHIGFDESLAHLLYAGADIFLMPSHFEPCGLSQLVSMRYGTVPVANKTGGLKDTVVEYDPDLQSGNGFLSDFSKQESFAEAVNRALSLYQQPEHWKMIKQNGMRGDYSWSRSAKEYASVYEGIAGK